MRSVNKNRYCPASFFRLLSFGRRCFDLRDDIRFDAAAIEFGPLGATLRDKNACILNYRAYSQKADQGAQLKEDFELNGGRRFRLTREQIFNNIWNIK